jgi:hypothetical protein
MSDEISAEVQRAWKLAKGQMAWKGGDPGYEQRGRILADAYVCAEAGRRKWEAIANLGPSSHLGWCEPESGCDGICADRYAVLTKTIENWVAEVEAELNK